MNDVKSYVDHAGAFDRQWQAITQSADTCGLPIEITKEEALSLFRTQGGRCALTGLPIRLGQPWGAPAQKTAGCSSLGRIDFSRGYAPNNVWWLHRDIGRMRSDLPLAQFLELCRAIVRRGASMGDRQDIRTRPGAGSKLSLAIPTVEEFLCHRAEKGSMHRERAAVLWQSYAEWCRLKGAPACTQKSFGLALRSLGYTRERGHVVTWFGLRLLPREGERVREGRFRPSQYAKTQ